jgi:hypothetical protein
VARSSGAGQLRGPRPLRVPHSTRAGQVKSSEQAEAASQQPKGADAEMHISQSGFAGARSRAPRPQLPVSATGPLASMRSGLVPASKGGTVLPPDTGDPQLASPTAVQSPYALG